MQYFQGPNTKQIRGRSRLLLADFAVVAVAADADCGPTSAAPVPTVAAASAASTTILSLFIVFLLLT